MKHFWGLSCSFDVCVQDNVFVTVVASVQFRAHVETAEDAFYKLTNPREQIKSYVFDGNFCNAGYGWIFFGFLCGGKIVCIFNSGFHPSLHLLMYVQEYPKVMNSWSKLVVEIFGFLL
jgi:hypothetical protein